MKSEAPQRRFSSSQNRKASSEKEFCDDAFFVDDIFGSISAYAQVKLRFQRDECEGKDRVAELVLRGKIRRAVASRVPEWQDYNLHRQSVVVQRGEWCQQHLDAFLHVVGR